MKPMIIRTRYKVAACIGLFLLGIAYYYLREEKPLAPQVEQPAPPGANLLLSGTTVVEEADGKRSWELKAEKMEVDPRTKAVRLIQVSAVVYRPNGGKIDITAQSAMVEEQTHDVVLEGDVKAVASDGGTFSAAKVKHVSKTRMFYANGNVVATRGDAQASGDAMETDVQLDKIKIQGKAKIVTGGNTNVQTQ